MYHAVIGKRLVECVNHRDGTNYTVREFFDDVYIPLFFGSARMFQHVNNSPFAQTFSNQKKTFTLELMNKCLNQLHDKVQDKEPDASFFLGGPAAGSEAKMSGQVTSIQIPVPSEDVYASWIGTALGLTLGGGITLLIDADDVLLATYDGWTEYRRHLDQIPNLTTLQVNTWNGQWVTHRLGKDADTTFKIATVKDVEKDANKLVPRNWIQLLFALSYHYSKQKSDKMLCYVYSFGEKGNETIGFIQLHLRSIKRLSDLYRELFTVPAGMIPAYFEALYKTEGTFRVACESTEIGLRAIKPTDVFKGQESVPKAPDTSDAEKQLAFDTYQTWIIAMLNNKELWERADNLASALSEFCSRDERGKNVRKQMVEHLLQTKQRREFIEQLRELLETDASLCNISEQTVCDLLLLPSDNVSLFLTLLRFKYAVVRSKA